MKITEVDLTDFVPDQDNANQGTQRGQKIIEDSLQEDGAARSIVVDEEGRVVAGNKTLEAAVSIGLEKAIVVETDGTELVVVKRKNWDLEDTQGPARRYAYRDNRSGELSLNWDPAQLLLDKEAGIDFGGLFYDNELDVITAGIEKEPPEDMGPQVNRADELRKKWGIEVGQVWVLGKHRLAVGDCTDKAVVEAVLEREKIESVITDPPYGIDWNTDYTRFTTEYGTRRINHKTIINDDGPFDPSPWLNYPKVVLWGANWYCQHIPLGSWLVWDKRHPSGTAWLSDAEIAWMKGKKGVYLYAETVQGAHRKEKSMHPTQKPVGLLMWCIQKADVSRYVFDPYLGSGTTLMACEQLGRRCRAVEIDAGYCGVTIERWVDLTGREPELTNS